jgi:hypothetical protein
MKVGEYCKRSVVAMAIDDAIDVVTGLMCDIAGSIRSGQQQECRARAG